MLRTPAPFTGALGVSLKRALAVLARHACEFRQKFVPYFLVFSKAVVSSVPKSGRVCSPCPVAQAKLCLRRILWPFRDLCLLWPACCSALTKGRSSSFLLLNSRGVGSAVLRACVCLLCPVAQPELSLRRAGPATKML